jgi:hypothetical protein
LAALGDDDSEQLQIVFIESKNAFVVCFTSEFPGQEESMVQGDPLLCFWIDGIFGMLESNVGVFANCNQSLSKLVSFVSLFWKLKNMSSEFVEFTLEGFLVFFLVGRECIGLLGGIIAIIGFALLVARNNTVFIVGSLGLVVASGLLLGGAASDIFLDDGNVSRGSTEDTGVSGYSYFKEVTGSAYDSANDEDGALKL